MTITFELPVCEVAATCILAEKIVRSLTIVTLALVAAVTFAAFLAFAINSMQHG